MKGEFSNIKIRGIVSATPESEMDNMEYISIFGKRRVKKQVQLTGIRKHRLLKKYQRPSDLCMCAAKGILKKTKWNKEDISILIFISQATDYHLPSTAIDLATRLGLSKNCLAYDINLGCSGFDLGLQTVSSLLQSQPDGGKALLLVGDCEYWPEGTCAFEPQDIINVMMFGGAGAAVAVEKVAEYSPIKFFNSSDGSNYDAIIRQNDISPTKMKGNIVFEFAINDVSDSIMEFKKYYGLKEEDIDFYCFHQAQKLIIDSIVSTCDIPEDKLLNSYEMYGNTSSASIPLSLCVCRDRFANRKKIRILTCGFGVGLSMGISFMEIDVDAIGTVESTDEHFDEHKDLCGILQSSKVIFPYGYDSELGKMLIRILDDLTASLILVENTQEKLDELRKQIFWNPFHHDICAENYEETAEIMEENSMDANAIVILTEYVEKKNLVADIERFVEKNVFSEHTGIVLVTEQSEMDNIEKKELLTKLKVILDKINGRVNMVCFEKEALDLYPKVLDSLDWFERRLYSEQPDKMVRPFYIGQVVGYLVRYSRSMTVSGSILYIDSDIGNL